MSANGDSSLSVRHDNEPVTLQRDVEAIMVPAGIPVTLRAGKTGFITQALGGSFTVYVEGNLFRIAGKDADALGKEAMRRARAAAGRDRRRREAAGLGSDARLLRPGDPDQHRRARAGVLVRDRARGGRRTHRATSR